MTKKIIQNELECTKCGDIVFSRHRHDFAQCSCGSIAADGGMDYFRRAGDGGYIDRSMSMDTKALNACKEAVKWGKDTGRNEFGIALAVIRALRDHELLDMEKFK